MRFLDSTLGLAALLLLSAAPADARPFRVDDIPNGQTFTCLNCHIDYKPSAQTDFGSDALGALIGTGNPSSKHVDWKVICPFDSDHDGWTNGVELGDPDCSWTPADDNPSGSVFNPGVRESHPPPICGNGKLDEGEACEGDMLADTDCAVYAAGEGTLSCKDDCSFDYSACSAPPGGIPPGPDGGGDDAEGCSTTPGRDNASYAGALTLLVGLALAREAARRRSQARLRR